MHASACVLGIKVSEHGTAEADGRKEEDFKKEILGSLRKFLGRLTENKKEKKI